jgi:hypothetical protein
MMFLGIPATLYVEPGADFGYGPGSRSIPVGTRVRVTNLDRPDVATGTVMARKWNTQGGCLVEHDDGPLYGWCWNELEEECLEIVPLMADMTNIHALDREALSTLNKLEPHEQELYLNDIFNSLYSGQSDV